MNTFKSVSSHSSRVLASYQRRIKQQNYLLVQIKSTLPTPLAEHVLYCVVSVKKLLIYTDSSIWSSQLRFYKQAMLDKVSHLVAVDSVKIKLLIQNPEAKFEGEVTIPSEKNINLLRHCGELMEDEKLKNALLNLSNTLNKLSS